LKSEQNLCEKLRKESKFLREYCPILESRSKERAINLKKTNENLRSLVAKKRTGGQRLTQAAAVLLITPDPVTDLAALPVLAAAQIVKMRSKKQSDMQRMMEGVTSDIASLFSLTELSYL
jgi:hypothetical protein